MPSTKENKTCFIVHNSPDFVTGIFITFSVTGILTAILGNSLIFLAVYKTYSLRTPSNYLLTSLSLASLLFVPVLASYTVSLTMSECHAIMPILCSWTSKVDFALFCVVMAHLAMISLDRLVAIKRPMRYSTMMTKRRTLVIITIVWIAGGIGGAIPGFFRLILRKQGRPLLQLMYGCIQNNVIPSKRELKSIIPHFLFLMSLTVLLPSGIMLFTHAWIFTISRSQLRRIRVLEDAVSIRRSSEMRAAKTVAVTVFSALACFTPLVVVNFITALDPPSGKKLTPTQINIKYILFPSLKILYLLAVTLNPFICALKTRPFKEKFKNYLKPLQIRLSVPLPTTLKHSGAKNIELTTTKNWNIEIARSTVL